MKMDSINISLPQSMADFVRGVVEREYGNASEFFRELVRERQQKEIAADVALLESTHAGAPVGPTESEIVEILKIQKKVRKGLRARRA
jgi:Arc/MetJ-type ribon-helix-helix transcriptional regulator